MKMARLRRSRVSLLWSEKISLYTTKPLEFPLDGDTFPSEYEGIDGPCSRTEHGKAYGEHGEQDVTFVPAWI